MMRKEKNYSLIQAVGDRIELALLPFCDIREVRVLLDKWLGW